MRREIVEGKIQGNERGYGFLIPNDKSKSDYFIPHGDLRDANHGDTVLCETTDGVGERTTARVLKILERGVSEIVGTYFSGKRGGFVTPDDRKYFRDIFVPFGKGLRAKSGDKVVCKIMTYPKRQNPEGLISKVLGRQFEKTAELKSIIYNYKLPEKFPKIVTEETELIPDKVKETDKKGRRNLCDKLIFTIDGDDSRDFDDAVSVEKDGDNYILGVHIADVSNYVKRGSEIDKCAYLRGTSVYFPESVIPMLPEKLSNGICSLNEGVERLTLSCIMKIDGMGNVLEYEIVPSVIKSKKRMTYSNVQRILDGDEEKRKEYLELLDSIFLMEQLADILKGKRDDKGSIDLEINESSIFVKDGKIEVMPSNSDKAHGIIEEFMIIANCTVAEYMYFAESPFVYRVHEKPTPERLENFYDFIGGLGINPKRNKSEVFSMDFQKILKEAEGKPTYSLINRIMLRTMQKARYSPEPLGHFGLSERYYCHFTSPIRRYPDLAVHRILKSYLSGDAEKLNELYGNYVYDVSEKSSEMEKNAMEAERAVDEYYKMLYISNFEGEEFDGIVSGVMNFGVFVELDNGIEGLVKIETLKGSRYKYDEKRYSLSNGRLTYKLGQSVRIKVVGVDVFKNRAEFIFAESSCQKEKNIVK